jgi:hypothetical protein
LQGSPEPPHPYLLVPAFPYLRFSDPMQMRWSPALKRYFVCELQGKIWSFGPEEDVASIDLVVELKRETEPTTPDRLKTGQDTSDLLSSILRIDVRNVSRVVAITAGVYAKGMSSFAAMIH